MSRRKRTSGGQAIVMVTLTLFAMVGLMGLAVDLGWSYFVQKEAQAAADSAALAAAQEAVHRLGVSSNVSGFRCPSNSGVECTELPGATVITSCATIATGDASSNLYNGCLYAMQNGFDYTKANRIVTMQSGDVTDLNAPPGVKRISYWVRARVIQTIPQLFSYLANNKLGTVAANATAAIAGSISPGNFYGMNHAGDCWQRPGEGSATPNCGMDLNANSTGVAGGACPGSGGGVGQACAPAGIFLASNCNSTSAGGNNCSQQWAGSATTGNGVETSSLVLYGTGPPPNGGAVVGSWHDAANNPVTPQYSTGASNFKDPTAPNPQPPLQTTTPIPSCGLPGGTLSGTAGPFQYYSYSVVNGKRIPDGHPITINGNVTFTNSSNSSTCPGGILSGGVNQSGSFNSFIFYGGVNLGGTKDSMNLISGQYVMAGVANNGLPGGLVLDSSSSGGTIQAANTSATSTGTMFIFTDGSYPGLGGPKVQGNASGTGQISAVPNWDQMPALYQGSINIKNSNITMDGLVNSSVGGSALPTTMNDYTGIVWWQDRRNSMVEYNQCTSSANCTNPTISPNYTCSYSSDPTACGKENGTVVGCADQSTGQCGSSQTFGEIATDNHVTSTSPGVVIDPGRGSLNVNGVYYQPRGAWAQLVHGTGLGTGNLQVLTGSLDLSSGNDKYLLQGPTNPLITYRAVLIQ
jgi:hypothetical protein